MLSDVGNMASPKIGASHCLPKMNPYGCVLAKNPNVDRAFIALCVTNILPVGPIKISVFVFELEPFQRGSAFFSFWKSLTSVNKKLSHAKFVFAQPEYTEDQKLSDCCTSMILTKWKSSSERFFCKITSRERIGDSWIESSRHFLNWVILQRWTQTHSGLFCRLVQKIQTNNFKISFSPERSVVDVYWCQLMFTRVSRDSCSIRPLCWSDPWGILRITRLHVPDIARAVAEEN